MLNVFGVYQTYYQNDFFRDISPSAISWIGSIQSCLLLLVGVITGPLYDKGYLRSTLVLGSFLVVAGMIATSLCTKYWQLLLAQAICIGLGIGLLYIPSVAVVPQYFRRRKALAMGLVAAGSSCGGIINSIVFTQLQPKIGFGWTLRVQALISLLTLSVATIVLRRQEPPSAEVKTLLELPAFREKPYLFYCLAMVTTNIAFFTPVFYVQSYALVHGLAGQSIALYLVTILTAASVIGRIAPSFIANKIGPVQTLFCCVGCTGITVFAWIGTNTGWGNIAFAAFFGLFSGGIVALPPVVLSSFTKDSRLGTRLGMSAVLNAIGSLIGAPIGGAILNATGSYLGIQLCAGISVAVTAGFLLALRFSLTGKKVIAKA